MYEKLTKRLKNYEEKHGIEYVQSFNEFDKYAMSFLKEDEEYVGYRKNDKDALPYAIIFKDEYGQELYKHSPYGIKKNILVDMQNDGLANLQEIKGYSFENYQTKNQWQKDILNGAKRFVSDPERLWFYIGGETGAGKTHICTSIVFGLASKGLTSKYISWTNFMALLRNDLNNAGERINIVKKQPILYIDDFFKTGKNFEVEKVRDYDSEIARDILWYRYDKNLPTIISTEVTLQELSRINDALVGRINENAKGYVFQPLGKDKNWRMK